MNQQQAIEAIEDELGASRGECEHRLSVKRHIGEIGDEWLALQHAGNAREDVRIIQRQAARVGAAVIRLLCQCDE